MAFYQLKTSQFLPADPADVWKFVATPRNLQRITPPEMGFDITSDGLPETMYRGMIVTYRVRPLLGIPLQWVTEITHLEEGSFFVDEQRAGPYTMWHHQHHILPADGGTQMDDIISYIPPLGLLGKIIHPLLIRPKLLQIFEYRRKVLTNFFPEP